MPRNLRSPAHFERLEDRLPFALDLGFDEAGRLIRIAEDAAGQQGAVALLVDPAGKVQVAEGATERGVFDVGRQLSVHLGSVTPGLVNVLQLAGNTLQTNLDVVLADQSPSAPPTQFRILGGRVDVEGSGVINGSVRERGGTGQQFFLFGEQSKAIPHVVRINGHLFVDSGTGGEPGGAPEPVGSVGSPPATAQLHVSGHVTVRNSTIFVLAGSVGGNLTVDSPAKIGTIPFLTSPGQLVTLGNFGRPLTIGGNVRVQTGPGADSISAENASIGGSLEIDSGAGDDYVQLANIDPANDPSNTAFIVAPSSVRRDVKIRLGSGNDALDVGADDGARTARFHVGGNLSVDAGTGNDTLRFLAARVDSARIRVETGAGDDVLQLRRINAPRAAFFAALGDGADSLTIDAAAELALRSFEADGGGDADQLEAGNLHSFGFRKSLRRF